MNGHGGHRASAGRKVGSKNVSKALRVGASLMAQSEKVKPEKVKPEKVEAAIVKLDEHESPLQILLDTMVLLRDKADELIRPHGSHVYVEEDDEGKVVARHGPMALRMMACQVAKEACPYLHARLSSVEASVKVSAYEASLLELAGDDAPVA